jgi:hypothetical protein
MRYELADFGWTAIKPFLPVSRVACHVRMTGACSTVSFGSFDPVRHGATSRKL